MAFKKALFKQLVYHSDVGSKRVKLDVPHIRQRHNTNCGPASLAMIMKYFKRKVREQGIERALKEMYDAHPIPKVRGTNRGNLVGVAREFGLIAYPKTNRTITDLERSLSGGSPVLVRIRGIKGWQHFTVLTGFDKKNRRFFCNDPFTNMKSIGYDEFKWVWNIPKTWVSSSTRNYAITFKAR